MAGCVSKSESDPNAKKASRKHEMRKHEKQLRALSPFSFRAFVFRAFVILFYVNRRYQSHASSPAVQPTIKRNANTSTRHVEKSSRARNSPLKPRARIACATRSERSWLRTKSVPATWPIVR